MALIGLLFGLLLVVPSRAAMAEDVMVEHLGLEMLGRLEIAEGAAPETEGVALVLHGTLAHHDVSTIRDLQANLKRRGVSTLAVTLSLNLDRRRGMFNCDAEHDHRHGDAVGELVTWMAWLKARGVSRIDLIGHSRGGAQVALFAAEEQPKMTGRLVLAAPFLDTSLAGLSERYEARFGKQLENFLRSAREYEDEGDDDTLLNVPGFLTCGASRVTAAAFLDYYAGKYRPLPRLLQSISAPTLIVAAGADEVVPEAAARLERGGLPPNAKLVTIDGADHGFLGRYAEQLADAISAFLKPQ